MFEIQIWFLTLLRSIRVLMFVTLGPVDCRSRAMTPVVTPQAGGECPQQTEKMYTTCGRTGLIHFTWWTSRPRPWSGWTWRCRWPGQSTASGSRRLVSSGQPSGLTSGTTWHSYIALSISYGWFLSRDIESSSNYASSHLTALKDQDLVKIFSQSEQNLKWLLRLVDKSTSDG